MTCFLPAVVADPTRQLPLKAEVAGWSWRPRREYGEALRGGQGPGARWGQSPGGVLRLPGGLGRSGPCLPDPGKPSGQAGSRAPSSCLLPGSWLGWASWAQLWAVGVHTKPWEDGGSQGQVWEPCRQPLQGAPRKDPAQAQVQLPSGLICPFPLSVWHSPCDQEGALRVSPVTSRARGQQVHRGWAVGGSALRGPAARSSSTSAHGRWARRSSPRGPQTQGLSGTTPGPVLPGKAVGAQ